MSRTEEGFRGESRPSSLCQTPAAGACWCGRDPAASPLACVPEGRTG